MKIRVAQAAPPPSREPAGGLVLVLTGPTQSPSTATLNEAYMKMRVSHPFLSHSRASHKLLIMRSLGGFVGEISGASRVGRQSSPGHDEENPQRVIWIWSPGIVDWRAAQEVSTHDDRPDDD